MLLWGESFDLGDYLDRLGTSTTTVSASYGRTDNGARVGDLTSEFIRIPCNPTVNKTVVGFAVRVVTVGGGVLAYIGSAGNTLSYDDSNNRLKLSIQIGATPVYLDIYTPNNSFQTNVFHYVEVRFTHKEDGTGTAQVGIDGSYVTEETAIDYYQTYSEFKIGGTSVSDVDEAHIDDIYVADNQGGVNDGFLGPSRAIGLGPNAAGNYSNLTRSAGAVNYENVDENPPNDGTDYNYSGVEGTKDSYGFEDLPGTPVVHGIIVAMNAKKSETGAKFLRPLLRIASTDYPGTSLVLAETYGLIEEAFDEDPNAAAAWTYTALNGTEIGAEVRNS